MHIAGEGEELMDGEAIEKYNKGISHVENILNLHKLRQEVLVKEKLAAVGRSSKSLTARNMRKFASTPNLFNAVRDVSESLLCVLVLLLKQIINESFNDKILECNRVEN